MAAGRTSIGTTTFERDPAGYRHWRVDIEAPLATVTMAVDPEAGWTGEHPLKLNSYDLGVDIELNDIVQRLRFEHPEVAAVVLTGGIDKMFCAGANIQTLAGSTHGHKVNFCKFTNETRNAIEDASERSGQVWLAAVNGTAAGGGYELALACDEIILVDDRFSAVSLPEVPLLGVLPGTGGLTRVVDKRHVRRDLADAFATRAEGVRGQQAVDWGLVDSVAAPSRFADHVRERALTRAAMSDRPTEAAGIRFTPLDPAIEADEMRYRHVEVRIDRAVRAAHVVVHGPSDDQPDALDDIVAAGDAWWPVAACRELDDAMLRLRFDEPEIGTWVLHTTGNADAMRDLEEVIARHGENWLVRETLLYWARTLRRLDMSARTLVALLEPGSCFAGILTELALAADRSLMLDGTFEGSEQVPATLVLTAANSGWLPMSNRLTRLQSRFFGHDEALAAALAELGSALDAAQAWQLGLVTATPDDLDWDDEVRLLLEERASFSPDALTGLEANLRFVGPETIETKIFARLSAWQNWIFQRPNASGPEGALRRYGSGARPRFDRERV